VGEQPPCHPVGHSIDASAAIIHNSDVKRTLMTIRAYTEGSRAMPIVDAAAQETARHHPDAGARKHNQAFSDS